MVGVSSQVVLVLITFLSVLILVDRSVLLIMGEVGYCQQYLVLTNWL